MWNRWTENAKSNNTNIKGKMKKLLMLIGVGLMSLSVAQAQEPMKLSLDKAIEIALSDNPTIQVANMEVERYDYVKKQTVSSLYPQIDASGQYALAIRKQEMTKGLSFGGKNTFNVAGNISLPLFVPSVYEQMKLNDTQKLAAVESARASKIDMIASVRMAYYNILLAEQSLKVLAEAEATTQRVVNDTKTLFENGLASEYDLITAEVQLSNLKPQKLQAENGVAITKMQLKMYLSLPENVEIEVTGTLDDFRDMVLMGENFNYNLDNNTTLKTLDLNAEMLEHQEKLIQTTRMPTIAAFAQVSLIGQERVDLSGLMGGMGGGAQQQALTRAAGSQSKFWWQVPITVGAQINIPIFSGLKKTNQLREVRNQQSQLALQREYAEEGIRLQVDQAINNLLTQRETMLSNSEVVNQATKAYDISKSRYDAGAGTMLELNNAQLVKTQAQLNYSQSIYNYLSAYAEYERVLGAEYQANN
jgi:outer membrane protein TolC